MSGIWKILLLALASVVGLTGCGGFQNDPAEYVYQCETSEAEAFDYQPWGTVDCGAGDPLLAGVEPELPTAICQTLVADKTGPDEDNLDTARVQAALTACKGTGGAAETDTGLRACLTAVGVEAWMPVWGDVASLDGRPAVVAVVTGDTGRLVFAVSPACDAAHPDVLAGPFPLP